MYPFCYVCGAESENVDDFNEHLEADHNWCSACSNKEYDTQEELIHHKINEHHFCRICQKYFASYSNLKYVGFPYPRSWIA